MTEDITNSPRFQRILLEAAEYRLLRSVFRAADRRLTDAKDTAAGAAKSGLRSDADPNSN
jgi:hypothetical protein